MLATQGHVENVGAGCDGWPIGTAEHADVTDDEPLSIDRASNGCAEGGIDFDARGDECRQ
jgi:hypothetical protein